MLTEGHQASLIEKIQIKERGGRGEAYPTGDNED